MEDQSTPVIPLIELEEYEYAAALLTRGLPQNEIRRILMKRGLDETHANMVVQGAASHLNRTKRPEVGAGKDLLIGGLVFLVGAYITLYGYAAAFGGSSYTIFWGAMGFGAFRFVRGIVKLMR